MDEKQGGKGEWKTAKWSAYMCFYEKGRRGRSSCPCFCRWLAFAFAVFLEWVQRMVSGLKRCVLYGGACCLMSDAVVYLRVCLWLEIENWTVVRNCCVMRMRSGIACAFNSLWTIMRFNAVSMKEMNSEVRLSPTHGGSCIECYPGMGCELLTNGDVNSGPFSSLDCIPPSFQLTASSLANG